MPERGPLRVLAGERKRRWGCSVHALLRPEEAAHTCGPAGHFTRALWSNGYELATRIAILCLNRALVADACVAPCRMVETIRRAQAAGQHLLLGEAARAGYAVGVAEVRRYVQACGEAALQDEWGFLAEALQPRESPHPPTGSEADYVVALQHLLLQWLAMFEFSEERRRRIWPN